MALGQQHCQHGMHCHKQHYAMAAITYAACLQNCCECVHKTAADGVHKNHKQKPVAAAASTGATRWEVKYCGRSPEWLWYSRQVQQHSRAFTLTYTGECVLYAQYVVTHISKAIQEYSSRLRVVVTSTLVSETTSTTIHKHNCLAAETGRKRAKKPNCVRGIKQGSRVLSHKLGMEICSK